MSSSTCFVATTHGMRDLTHHYELLRHAARERFAIELNGDTSEEPLRTYGQSLSGANKKAWHDWWLRNPLPRDRDETHGACSPPLLLLQHVRSTLSTVYNSTNMGVEYSFRRGVRFRVEEREGRHGMRWTEVSALVVDRYDQWHRVCELTALRTSCTTRALGAQLLDDFEALVCMEAPCRSDLSKTRRQALEEEMNARKRRHTTVTRKPSTHSSTTKSRKRRRRK